MNLTDMERDVAARQHAQFEGVIAAGADFSPCAVYYAGDDLLGMAIGDGPMLDFVPEQDRSVANVNALLRPAGAVKGLTLVGLAGMTILELGGGGRYQIDALSLAFAHRDGRRRTIVHPYVREGSRIVWDPDRDSIKDDDTQGVRVLDLLAKAYDPATTITALDAWTAIDDRPDLQFGVVAFTMKTTMEYSHVVVMHDGELVTI